MKNKDIITQELEYRYKDKYWCKECGKGYRQKGALYTHMKQEHPKVKKFKHCGGDMVV